MVLLNESAPPFDFDCLRTPTEHLGSAARVLGAPGSVGSVAACAELCAATAYRGLPCRAFTWYSDAAPVRFRRGCYGRTDVAGASVAALEREVAGATSAALADQPDCASDAQCELNGRCVAGACAWPRQPLAKPDANGRRACSSAACASSLPGAPASMRSRAGCSTHFART